METWEKALTLEHFIRDFVPAGWTQSISKVMFVPFISEQDIKDIEDGTLPEKLSKPPILWAVRAFLFRDSK